MGLLDNSHNNSRPARLPALPSVPRGVDPAMHQLLEAIKERLEVREGARGNQFERVVTERRLAEFMDSSVFRSAVAKLGASGASTQQVAAAQESANIDAAVRNAINRMGLVGAGGGSDAAAAAVRSELLRKISALESGGGMTPEQVATRRPATYTTSDLAADLAAGGAAIISGAASGSTRMELDPAGNYVVFKHKDASVGGSTGAYSGTVRTAVGITAAGFLAGYNRTSDGAWQNTIVIDSTTGNVTIQGTLKANSVIEVGALIGVGGQTIGTVAGNASAAYAGLGDKLSKAGGEILSGAITFNSAGGFKTSGITIASDGSSSGTGVAVTSAGIVGRNGSGITFAIDTSGNATFKGDITGASGTFAGNVSTNGYVHANGQITTADGFASVVGNESGTAATGLIGYGKGTTGRGVHGISDSSGGLGAGVLGDGRASHPGVFGRHFGSGSGVHGYSASGVGVYGIGAVGVVCQGAFGWGPYTYAQPNGSASLFMRADGTWATPSIGSVDWSAVTSKPSTFTPSAHGHYLSDIQPNNFDTPSFQFSTDGGATWTGILLKRL